MVWKTYKEARHANIQLEGNMLYGQPIGSWLDAAIISAKEWQLPDDSQLTSQLSDSVL